MPLSRTPSKAQQDLFASDVLRYFLLREIPFGQDGNFSLEAMVTRYNADLANGYGNLVSRTLNMIQQYFDGAIPQKGGFPWTPFSAPDQSFNWDNLHLYDVKTYVFDGTGFQEYDALDFNRRIEVIMGGVSLCDSTLTQAAPWKLVKQPGEESTVSGLLYEIADAIRIITALLYPILPYATASVWRQLGLGDIEEAARTGRLKDLEWGGLKPGTELGPLAPIFPRADKGLTAIMIQMEQDKNTPISHANAAHDASTNTFTDFPEMSLASATFDPAAPPRTSTFTEPNPGLHVAASTAHTTERPGTPSHSEAPVSGIFAAEAAAAAPQTIAQIGIDDFAKVELRVAKILVAERIPKADKLLRLEVDLGDEKRQILSGIAEWYTPEDLIGRRIVVITNLAPRKMRGLESHGMLLAASHGENGKPFLATFLESDEVPVGSRLK